MPSMFPMMPQPFLQFPQQLRNLLNKETQVQTLGFVIAIIFAFIPISFFIAFVNRGRATNLGVLSDTRPIRNYESFEKFDFCLVRFEAF
jgi:undecaprenyl pyrophosphate phosphatase UppP